MLILSVVNGRLESKAVKLQFVAALRFSAEL